MRDRDNPRMRVGGGQGQAAGAQAGQVRQVVAHEGDFVHADAHLHRDPLQAGQLAALAGMHMRQSQFAAALLHSPRVMIIDEPMVGLDPHSARIVKDLLKAKSREGVTIFLSTQTLSVAEELADRIGIIDRGRLIAAGSVAELGRSAGIEGRLEDVFLRLTEEEAE